MGSRGQVRRTQIEDAVSDPVSRGKAGTGLPFRPRPHTAVSVERGGHSGLTAYSPSSALALRMTLTRRFHPEILPKRSVDGIYYSGTKIAGQTTGCPEKRFRKHGRAPGTEGSAGRARALVLSEEDSKIQSPVRVSGTAVESVTRPLEEPLQADVRTEKKYLRVSERRALLIPFRWQKGLWHPPTGASGPVWLELFTQESPLGEGGPGTSD